MSKLDSALALIACIIQWGKQTNQIIQEYRLRCSEFHCQVLGLYKRLLVVPQYFVFLIFHSSWNCSYSYTTLNEANICQLFFFPVKVDMQLSSDQQDKCEHIMWQFLAIFPRTTWWVSFVPSVCPLLLSSLASIHPSPNHILTSPWMCLGVEMVSSQSWYVSFHRLISMLIKTDPGQEPSY